MDGDKIRPPITEVLLRAAAGNLARSKNQWEWTPRNTVLLPPFLMKAKILDGQTTAEELLKIVACSVTEIAEEKEEKDGDEDNKYIKGGE